VRIGADVTRTAVDFGADVTGTAVLRAIIGLVPSRSRFTIAFVLVLIPLLAALGIVAYVGWRQSVPGVRVATAPPALLGHKTPVTVALQAARGNVARAEVRVLQSGKTTVVARFDGPPIPRVELPVTIEPTALGVREGDAALEVWARDDFWRPIRLDDRSIAQFPVKVDLTPPRIEILAATQYVSPGGAALVAFRLPDAARAEVRIGAYAFPSFPYGPPDKGARVALIALPWDFAGNAAMSVNAVDEAGNTAVRAIPAELKPRKFPRDTIQITGALLEAKVPELLPQRPPSQPLIDGFLVVNREHRRQAEEEKRRIGAKTADRPFWEGVFVQPRNTKVFANFAESRTYLYQGQAVDTQVHFGYDLAATKNMPVPAANKGVVIFAAPLTIYGNTVVIDHGLGLQTFYAHLSSVGVNPGDSVQKGQEIGRSGTTGLAIGDHLHYEVLVHGVSVTPLEWWDAKWLRDRIAKPLRDAGLPEIAGIAPPAGEVAPAPAVPRSTRRGAR
jgi:murein DD-endopeptidase MepM/ murein hydrolase activator NlpD